MLIVSVTLDEAAAAQELIEIEMASPEKDRISIWHHLPGLLEKLQKAKDPIEIMEGIADLISSPHGDVLSVIELLKTAGYIPR